MTEPLYRKKALITARQWFSNGHCPVWAQAKVREHGTHFEIATREGRLTGEPGDWIARGVEGEVYPIGAEIFAATYEPVSPASGGVSGEDGELIARLQQVSSMGYVVDNATAAAAAARIVALLAERDGLKAEQASREIYRQQQVELWIETCDKLGTARRALSASNAALADAQKRIAELEATK